MKKMWKLLAATLAFSFTLGLAVACGGGGDSSSNGAQQSGNSQTDGNASESEEAKEPIEITGVTFEDFSLHYDGEEHELLVSGELPSGVSVSYQNNKGMNAGVYEATATLSGDGYKTKVLKATLEILLTAEDVVEARQNVLNATTENYDFTLDFNGSMEVLGISGSVGGTYDGQYRYNKDTGEVNFKRTMSGALLNDSTEYVFTQSVQKIKINMEEDGEVKKVSVVPNEEEGLTLVNKPVVAIVNSLKAENITAITKLSSGEYDYKANLKFGSDNTYLNALCNVLGGLGTSVSIKGVEFTNPLSGIELYFNMDGDMLDSFCLSAQLSVPVKAVDVTMSFTYKQEPKSTQVQIPSTSGVVMSQSGIANELAVINNAMTALKNSDAYSLDLTAENQFDPAWNVLATTDKYEARMYKNTIDGNAWFNHSYRYRTHHETDGAEAYEYTLGNLSDGTNKVYLVSRRGTNTAEEKTGISADTQFDYLTGMVMQTAKNVDCIRKETDGDTTVYRVYLGKNATLTMQDRILDIINSNEGEGVVDVNNYFNSTAYTINEAEVVVELKNGEIVGIDCKTELCYEPTAGEYTEYNITLTDTVKLRVNEKLEEAQDYEAPEKLEEKILGVIKGGLMFMSYFIL